MVGVGRLSLCEAVCAVGVLALLAWPVCLPSSLFSTGACRGFGAVPLWAGVLNGYERPNEPKRR